MEPTAVWCNKKGHKNKLFILSTSCPFYFYSASLIYDSSQREALMKVTLFLPKKKCTSREHQE